MQEGTFVHDPTLTNMPVPVGQHRAVFWRGYLMGVPAIVACCVSRDRFGLAGPRPPLPPPPPPAVCAGPGTAAGAAAEALRLAPLAAGELSLVVFGCPAPRAT